ncbi:hypothetical protein J0J22_24010, partial [Vibrio vulnificus]
MTTKVVVKPEFFEEIAGKGLIGIVNGQKYLIGSPMLLGEQKEKVLNETAFHIKINDEYKGKFIFA